LCVSPDGLLLLAIDIEGKALLINRKRQVLHHFSFKGPVATAKFSPDGQYIACGVQRLVQVSPALLSLLLVCNQNVVLHVKACHPTSQMMLPCFPYLLLQLAICLIRSTVSADLLIHAQMPMSYM